MESSPEPLKLKKFKPKDMRDSCVTVFVASKGSGKSVCMNNFMYHKKHIPVWICCSASEEANSFFQTKVHPMYTFGELNTDKLTMIYNYQEIKLKEYKHPRNLIDAAKKKHGVPNMCDSDFEKISFWDVWAKDPHVGIVLEDLMAEKKAFNHKIIRELLMNGRHFKIYVLVTVQYIVDLPRALRSNVDYWVIFKEDSKKNRENLFIHVASKTKELEIFNDIMDACTVNHGCVVIDCRINTGDISDSVFWYRADLEIPEYRVGSARYWKFADMNYVPQENQHRHLIEEVKHRLNFKSSSNNAEANPIPKNVPSVFSTNNAHNKRMTDPRVILANEDEEKT